MCAFSSLYYYFCHHKPPPVSFAAYLCTEDIFPWGALSVLSVGLQVTLLFIYSTELVPAISICVIVEAEERFIFAQSVTRVLLFIPSATG